jgi:hypothetical protein
MRLKLEVKPNRVINFYLYIDNVLFADYEALGQNVYFCGVFEYHSPNEKLPALENALYASAEQAERVHEVVKALVLQGGGEATIEI